MVQPARANASSSKSASGIGPALIFVTVVLGIAAAAIFYPSSQGRRVGDANNTRPSVRTVRTVPVPPSPPTSSLSSELH
jgi:hypothetical protein